MADEYEWKRNENGFIVSPGVSKISARTIQGGALLGFLVGDRNHATESLQMALSLPQIQDLQRVLAQVQKALETQQKQSAPVQ